MDKVIAGWLVNSEDTISNFQIIKVSRREFGFDTTSGFCTRSKDNMRMKGGKILSNLIKIYSMLFF